MTVDDLQRMKALADRQAKLFQDLSKHGLELIAKSVAPFTTGLGNEHPLENGFAFLNPYGLPYLPGSGVKGVVRRAAEELAHRDFFENDSGWTLPAIWHLFGFERWPKPKDEPNQAAWAEWVDGFPVRPEELEAYLGRVLDSRSASHVELKNKILSAPNPLRALVCERQLHVRGALDFWDVVPQVPRSVNLRAEIMTPHQSHYYQPKEKKHAGSVAPHDSGKPTPISFLTVPPGSGFTFRVHCDRHRLARCSRQLSAGDGWRELLHSAFEHAFEWLGFGAKTTVGYGTMELDPRIREAQRRRQEEEAAHREREQAERAEIARRKAEQDAFDALPESEKRLRQARQSLRHFQAGSKHDLNLRNEVKHQANRLTEEAPGWSDAAAKRNAAELLEQVYESIGWHEPGAKAARRKKQEQRKHDAIARIRGDTMADR